MAENSAAFEMQKELRQTEPVDEVVSSASASGSSQASGQSDNLEDLFSTLKQQISKSDWLQKNTAEKWVEENPELAKQYMEASKKT